MSQIAPAKIGQNRRMLLIVSVVTVCFFAVSNLPWTLDDYDQAKQAFVSFQMIGQQRWLYQTTPDEGTKASGGRHSPHHINSKPPAVAWVSAALYQLTRSWDFAWRFPSFVAALVLAVLVFRGARTFGDLPALCALAAFGLNLLSVRLATLVRTDMPLALVSFALLCLWVIFGIRFIDGFYEDVILNEFGARFHEGIHRSQPLLFYIPHLLQKFAPWSLLILGLLVVALRKTKAATGKWLRNL